MAKKIGKEIDISDSDKAILDGYAARQGATTEDVVQAHLEGLITTAKSGLISAWWRGLPLSEQYRIYEENQ